MQFSEVTSWIEDLNEQISQAKSDETVMKDLCTKSRDITKQGDCSLAWHNSRSCLSLF